MQKREFQERLALLRTQKDVSARDMSISLGQNEGYINSIESGRSLPSMENFFYICDYLGITPKDFFDVEIAAPQELKVLVKKLHRLNRYQTRLIGNLVDEIIEHN